MRAKRLLAAITASGALLCLNLTAKAHNPDPSRGADESETLAVRVDRMKEKLRSHAPAGEQSGPREQIRNVVQFFNFLNSKKKPRTK